MIDEVTQALMDNNFEETHIHYELFTNSEDGLEIAPQQETATLIVTLDDEEFEFSMSTGKSVLEAALENNLDAPFSCQGGICSTCIAKIKEGTAHMRKNEILTDEEIAEGFILTCQAQVSSKVLVIDYDDV